MNLSSIVRTTTCLLAVFFATNIFAADELYRVCGSYGWVPTKSLVVDQCERKNTDYLETVKGRTGAITDIPKSIESAKSYAEAVAYQVAHESSVVQLPLQKLVNAPYSYNPGSGRRAIANKNQNPKLFEEVNKEENEIKKSDESNGARMPAGTSAASLNSGSLAANSAATVNGLRGSAGAARADAKVKFGKRNTELAEDLTPQKTIIERDTEIIREVPSDRTYYNSRSMGVASTNYPQQGQSASATVTITDNRNRGDDSRFYARRESEVGNTRFATRDSTTAANVAAAPVKNGEYKPAPASSSKSDYQAPEWKPETHSRPEYTAAYLERFGFKGENAQRDFEARYANLHYSVNCGNPTEWPHYSEVQLCTCADYVRKHIVNVCTTPDYQAALGYPKNVDECQKKTKEFRQKNKSMLISLPKLEMLQDVETLAKSLKIKDFSFVKQLNENGQRVDGKKLTAVEKQFISGTCKIAIRRDRINSWFESLPENEKQLKTYLKLSGNSSSEQKTFCDGVANAEKTETDYAKSRFFKEFSKTILERIDVVLSEDSNLIVTPNKQQNIQSVIQEIHAKLNTNLFGKSINHQVESAIYVGNLDTQIKTIKNCDKRASTEFFKKPFETSATTSNNKGKK